MNNRMIQNRKLKLQDSSRPQAMPANTPRMINHSVMNASLTHKGSHFLRCLGSLGLHSCCDRQYNSAVKNMITMMKSRTTPAVCQSHISLLYKRDIALTSIPPSPLPEEI